MEISSIGTYSARRLASFPQFQLATPLVNSYTLGATVTNWGLASLFTGGDPVTYFGGRKWKFWLPVHQELLLLATPVGASRFEVERLRRSSSLAGPFQARTGGFEGFTWPLAAWNVEFECLRACSRCLFEGKSW